MRPAVSPTSQLAVGTEALSIFMGLRSSIVRRAQLCCHCRYSSSAVPKVSKFKSGSSTTSVTIDDKTIEKDEWYNVSSSISNSIRRRLHLQEDHPISITRQIIESRFPAPTYKYHNTFSPIVTTQQNFDSLGFPADHPGRSKSDTYYINESTVLRTHTSAHQADIFRANESSGFLISADVYRRDAIDRSHYPIFHQMEGARMWDRTQVPNGDIAAAVYADIEKLPKHDMKVEDPNPPYHAERNPLQKDHTAAEAEAIAAHLKRSLELVVVEIFKRAAQAAKNANPEYVDEPLKVRWIEAYFPFTSPSWELEVFWQGDWLEVLGCGVVQQDIFKKSGVPDQVGWAFGIGLERIAMLLFEVPDIRLFWSQDPRFLGQFEGLSENLDAMKRFVPFSKYPASPRDVSFWLPSTSSSAGGGTAVNTKDFHENDVMEIVRDIARDVVEDVRVFDEFTHPKTGRKSLCYKVTYRSLEKTLTGNEANGFHEKVRKALVEKLGVELR